MSVPPRPQSVAAEPPAPLDTGVWRALLLFAGGSLVLIGAVGLAAWATGNPEYIQLDPALQPLHYNAALGLIAWGVGYLALARRGFGLARACGVGLLLLAVVTAAAHIPGLYLGLARWAFPLPAGVPFPPAGVTPGLSLAVGLGGVALLLLARREVSDTEALLCGLGGLFLLLAAPTVLMLARAGKLPGHVLGPALLAVIGVWIGSLVLLGTAIRRGLPSWSVGPALPLTVGLAGIVLTLGLWQALNREQHSRIHRQVQFEAAHVRRQVQEVLPAHLAVVTGLAQRWNPADPGNNKSEAGSYVGQVPACLGVARVDPELGVHWIEVRQTPPPPDTPAELGIAGPLAEAVEHGEPVVLRPPRSNWDGTRVVVVFAPHRPGAPDGGLLSVLRVQNLFDGIANADLAAGYAVAVTENGEPIFGRFDSDVRYRDRWAQSLPLDFGELGWRLTVWPTQNLLDHESLSVPRLALVIGLLTTCLLALAVHLAQTARRRAFALENEAREREQAQRALSHSEQKYRSLVENLGQGVFLQDRDRRYVAANARFCQTLGRSEAEIVGRTEEELFDPRRAAVYADEARTVLAEGKSVESEEEWAVDGRRVNVRRVLTPVRDTAGQTTGVLGICWDVTEQRQLEAHVHQASKMDAIGQLAGGIAHDFNNLLTVILGNLELLKANLPPGDRNRELTASAHHATTRAASLTQRLLGFSRRHQLDWVPTNLNGVVEEVTALLRRTIDPLIQIETHLAPELWPVHADPAQLNQVLMNLCLNARDAIDGPGRIRIDDRRRAGRGRPTGQAGRRFRPAERHGHRAGDDRRGEGQDLRAVLHHQAGRQGHRAGAADGLRHRPPAQGMDRLFLRGRPRHAVRHLSAPGRAGPTGGSPRSRHGHPRPRSPGQGDDPGGG
jgi:PAS domain S-box-containing protein